jgi:hypothetical protein
MLWPAASKLSEPAIGIANGHHLMYYWRICRTCWTSSAANPFEERRTTIRGWRQYATVDVEETVMILQSASLLVGTGLKAKDALHIACAIAGECKYLVTTDDGILNRRQDIHAITLIDPTALVREMNL